MGIDYSKQPNIIPWPPLIYLLATGAAFLLHIFVPWQLLNNNLGWWLGLSIAAFGVILDFWAMIVMVRAATNVLPHRAAERLITWGPFAWTRNPIYLGNAIGLFGFGLAFSGWFLVMGLVAGIAINHFAIRREEFHLASRFDKEWETYCRKVPRWIGIRISN